jgi:hypothetical protein
MTREVELWQPRGAASDAAFVAVVDIPSRPDSDLPAVVEWGLRTFVRRDTHEDLPIPWAARRSLGTRPIYDEVSAVRSFTGMPGKARGAPVRLGRILCLFGLHRWETVYRDDADRVEEACGRCGWRRGWITF